MQTDILLKQVYSSLSELKTAIEKFEKHASPSTQYSENLYKALNDCNKLVSAYLVIKEQKDVAPDLNLHLKLMNVPKPQEEQVIVDVKPNTPATEPVAEPIIEIDPVITEVIESNKTISAQTNPIKDKTYPPLAININDKFRMINDLFSGNANEYNIAVEQINTVNTLEDAMIYIKGLKEIYMWKEDHEMVVKIITLTQKRFS